MTPAECAYRLALHAYPAAYRRERGLEILTTILDGGAGRWPRRRELLAVVLAGIARRGQVAGGGSRAGSMRAGVRLAAFAWLLPYAVAGVMWALYPYIGARWLGGGASFWHAGYAALIALGPLFALARSWWWGPLAVSAGSTAISALGFPGAATWPWDAGQHAARASVLLALWLAPGVACVLARPRSGEPRDRRSLLWLPAAAAAGALFAQQGLFVTSWLGRPLVLAMLAGLVLARRDPRLAVATAGVALLAAADRIAEPMAYGPLWLGAGALLTPFLLALALASLWRLRRAVA
jgi:hypothetical protein